MKSGHLFSIIIPLYNAGELFEHTLNSLKNQTFRDFEVVVVDDGSTDCSVSIVSKYQELDSRFKCIIQQNAGPNVARNLALKNISGEYVLFLDSDDVFSPNTLRTLVNKLQVEDFDLINFGYEFRDLETNKVIHQSNYEDIELNKNDIFISALTSGGISGVCWNKCVKAKLLTDNAIWFTADRMHGRDILFSREVSFYASKALIINDVLVTSRYRSGSYSRNFSPKNILSALDLANRHDKKFTGVLDKKERNMLYGALGRHLRYIAILNAFRESDYAVYRINHQKLKSSPYFELASSSTSKISTLKHYLLKALVKRAQVLRVVANICQKFGYKPY